MRLIINGKHEEIPGAELPLPDLLRLREVRHPETVTVELNGTILKQRDIPRTVVRNGDALELIYFIGGGMDSMRGVRHAI